MNIMKIITWLVNCLPSVNYISVFGVLLFIICCSNPKYLTVIHTYSGDRLPDFKLALLELHHKGSAEAMRYGGCLIMLHKVGDFSFEPAISSKVIALLPGKHKFKFSVRKYTNIKHEISSFTGSEEVEFSFSDTPVIEEFEFIEG